MRIAKLYDEMRKVEASGKITEIGETRTVTLRTGDTARVADCKLTDSSGTIALSLWNDQIDEVHVGSQVEVTNGYTNSFRGELRLNVGKYGQLKVS
jgi:replication factor A1